MPAGIQPGRNGLLSYDRYGGVFREDEHIGFVIEMHVKKKQVTYEVPAFVFKSVSTGLIIENFA